MQKNSATGEIDKITWDTIAENLDTADIPDPDLLVRTSGEMRLSNYLHDASSISATVLYKNILAQDFGAQRNSPRRIDEFKRRERRYGLTGDQLK